MIGCICCVESSIFEVSIFSEVVAYIWKKLLIFGRCSLHSEDIAYFWKVDCGVSKIVAYQMPPILWLSLFFGTSHEIIYFSCSLFWTRGSF